MSKEDEIYYSGQKLLSYNAPTSIVCSVRGPGKSYYFIRMLINSYIRHGACSYYMRRTDTQIKAIMSSNNLLSGIIKNDEFPGYELALKNRAICVRKTVPEGEKENKWEVAVHLVALSGANNQRSNGDETARFIFFDEFIKQRNERYLPNEVTLLMDFWDTVDRAHNRCRLIMAANAMSINNPYFLEWGINLRSDSPRFTRYANKSKVVEYIRFNDLHPKLQERIKNSYVYQAAAGTDYGEMAFDAHFKEDTEAFITRELPADASPWATLVFDGKAVTIYICSSAGDYIVRSGRGGDEYALTREDMRPNMIMLQRANPTIKGLARMYRYGFIQFDSVRTRETVTNMLAALGQI